MGIGAKVRRMFGRHERLVADLWRGAFISLDDLAARLQSWVPKATNILEIGCGEGAVTERLANTYPGATITAIDIAPNLGRLYRGPRDRVYFKKVAVGDLLPHHAGRFDLIIMCDVLHHIPHDLRRDVLEAARALLAPGGSFVCKDWARAATPIHWAAYSADRWLTGDRISYASVDEAEELFAGIFGPSALRSGARIRPWRNNYALLMTPGA